MELTTKRYQHFKGGNYKVYGAISPLPNRIHEDIFSFTAKEADNATEIEIIVTKDGLFFEPFRDEDMVLYLSESTNEWWLREKEEFYGYKNDTKRFTLLDNKEYRITIN